MKQAHVYKLEVEFLDGHKWDIDILAVDASWVSMWADHVADQIQTMKITLLQRNYKLMSDNFGAKDISDNWKG